MPKLLLKATELTDTNVDFVALVKRGANRIPFRIVKKDDEPMLDLYKIGRDLFKKAEIAPSVVAIVIAKADVDAVKLTAVAKACGLTAKLTKSEDDAGTLLFAPDGATLEGAFLVKLDDDIAVAVKGSTLRKAFPDVDYVEGPTLARKSMDAAIREGLEEAEGLTGANEVVLKATEAYIGHMHRLSEHLPEAVFKAEQALKACGTGNAKGGGACDQETGDGLGDKANGKARKDAGKNGTGEGFEAGGGTETTPSATDDDEDEEIDAKPGARVSGDNSGMPAKAKAPTAKVEGQKPEDDDSTTGTQTKIPAKLKAPTKKDAHTVDVRTKEPKGESPAGEGITEALDDRDNVSDDEITAGAQDRGKVKGKTLDMSGMPAKAKAPTAKNDGDAAIGKKGQGRTAPDDESEAGAEEEDVQTLKSDVAGVMQAIQALAKSVQESNASQNKTVTELAKRVDSVVAMAKKTDAALNGTVFNEEGDDRQTWTRKSEDNAPPLLDTGLSRRRA